MKPIEGVMMSENDVSTEVEEQPSKKQKIQTTVAEIAITVLVSFAAGAVNEVLKAKAVQAIEKHNKK
jgi:hypothetical protein